MAKIRLPPELIAEKAKTGESDETKPTLPKPLADALPELAAYFRKGQREGKRVVMLPIDADIVEAFMETGEGWTERMEAALRLALADKKS